MNDNSVRSLDCQHPDWKEHWQKLYAENGPDSVSWYQSHPQHSLALIEDTGIGGSASIIDIGGGAATLVDYLLKAGYRDITVLDIARAAIQQAQQRLGDQSQRVTWVEDDITRNSPTRQFDIWHDRAVFHYLTVEHDRSCYLDVLQKTLKPHGQAIIATFSEYGPDQCSGLEVVRYSPQTLQQALGNQLQLLETITDEHHTPDGGVQQFVYCRFSRKD
ncbi:class I SAM-dependent methyltransferase [Gammaproteobacteria bacterium]|nr:class I SAM-dependent methyltransferase [Gammaproteobacteria bacterium]